MRDCKKFCWKKSPKNITPPPVDYSKKYLTFEALEDTIFTFSQNALQYSIDNGSTWTILNAGTSTPTITAGNKILWKQTGLTPDENGIGRFSSTGEYNAYGNVMSLYYGDDFENKTDLTEKDYAFAELFFENINLVDVSNLVLPATTLSIECYAGMFQGCTSLTTAPSLPATTLANYCYDSMFYGCTSLTTAHALPATTLAEGCYANMFDSCTSLTSAPELPATILANYCYQSMFNGCTSLTTAPELPATTLVEYCYSGMFYNCTSLTEAPELPATTLITNCYYGMFQGCTNLNYIKCLATNIPATNCTDNWVNGVASSGTFVKDASMSSWTTGSSGIPSGWTVESA